MDNKKQYYTDEYKNLLNFYESNIDTLDNKAKKLIKDQLSIYDNTFKGDKNAIDFLTKNSAELKQLFEELNKSFEDIEIKVTSNSGYTDSVITSHPGATKEDLDKAVEAKEKLDKIEAEKKVLLSEIDEIDDILNTLGSVLSSDEIDKLNDEKTVLTKEVNKKTIEETKLRPLKGVFTDAELDGEISNREELNKLTEEQLNLLDKVSLKQEEINELTVEHTKNVGAFTEMAKAAGNAMIVIAKAGFEKWKEIDEKVFSVGRQIGLSSNQLRNYQQNVLNNYDELASRLGMSFEELFKFQESYSKNTGRAIMLTNEQVESLGTMSKLVGDVATNDMVKNMDDFGASTQTATSYLALNMARARSQGLDAQKASEAFSKNVKLASQYTFREGVNGISKMTLLSQKLKFNMDSIANVAEKFETVEGAIGTAANIQMLGGNYAAQFGNPLEAMNMAMLDMEGFTQKIVDTFSGKAMFNRETGQVEMSAIDKRLMKEAAKQLGISYEEAWNMASQKAKIGDVERQLGLNSNTFTEDEKSWITSNSQYNAETKQHQVTYFGKDGEQKTVDVKDLTAEQLKEVRAQAISEKAIQSDVHGIHSLLKAYAQKEMGDSKSWNEMQKGWQESMEINVADAEDGILNWTKQKILRPLTDENWWLAKLGLDFGKLALGGLIVKYVGNFLTQGLGNIGGKLSPSMFKGKKWFKGLGGKIASSARGAWTWAKGAGRGLGSGVARGATRAGQFLMRMPGWAKVAGGVITAIGAGAALMSAADGSQVDKRYLGGREPDPNDINSTPINPENIEETKELSELEKQTVLLQAIADKQGVDTARILDLSKTNISNTTQEAGVTESSLGFLAATFGDKIYNKFGAKSMPKAVQNVNTTLSSKIQNVSTRLGDKVQNFGAKLGDKGADIQLKNSGVKKLGGKALNKFGNKTLQNVGSKAIGLGSKLATKGLAGPAGWVGFGVDMINMGGQSLGLWEEGSHTDKLMNIGSKTASFAGIGAMIAGPVGAAVGGAVGLVTGTIQQYGKEIKAFGSKVYTGVKEGLFGKDNMTEADKIQQSYEETKMGIVDITDPQLEQKAYLATCKIHDIVVSMWHHMNGKQSNGLKEDKGLLGGFGDTVNTVNNTIGGALVSTITSPFKVVGGLVSSIFNGGAKSNVSANKNEYSSISSQYVNALSTNNESVINGVSTNVSNINDLSRVDRQYISKASKSSACE